MAYKVSGTDLPATEFNPEEWSVVLNARQRSPRQQSKETEGTQSSKAASAAETPARKTESPPSVSSKLDDTAVARPRLKRLPRFPVDEFKMVLRPSAGVDLAQCNDGELRAAVVANSGLHSVVADEDLVCTNLAKNIFTVSTSCADRVANYAKIRELTPRGEKLGFHAYIAPPDGARAGIIYRAWNDKSATDDMYVLCQIASLAQAEDRNTRRTIPAPRSASSVGTLTRLVTGHASNAFSVASAVSLGHDKGRNKSTSRSSPSSSSRRSFFHDDRNRSSKSKSPGRNRGSKGKSPGRSASQSRDFSTKPEKADGSSPPEPENATMASNNNVHVNPDRAGDGGTSNHESFRDDGVGPPLSPHSSRDNQAPPLYLECMRVVATLAECRARWVIPVETTEYTCIACLLRPGGPGPEKFLSGRLPLEQPARPSGLRHDEYYLQPMHGTQRPVFAGDAWEQFVPHINEWNRRKGRFRGNQSRTAASGADWFTRPLRPQRHAEAIYALIEARCDRDIAIKNRRLQLEEDRLRFEIKRHEQEMKLKEMELQQRQAEQEAKLKLKKLEFQLRRQELEALAEERRHNKGYQQAQLEIIKSFINK
ncbi:hypothetical protein HPB51_021471 [Rhipicephalus microplus]|uniref:Uncharacterized protein n=1 Tax=Rhipicephalus microplus TaxID=6941 RepID=A0A9J6DIX0_RHIMP|nr:hypothetical protein HPB51_021471 [Rhipicephalus microplus]